MTFLPDPPDDRRVLHRALPDNEERGRYPGRIQDVE
jgi:hypothetical protein